MMIILIVVKSYFDFGLIYKLGYGDFPIFPSDCVKPLSKYLQTSHIFQRAFG